MALCNNLHSVVVCQPCKPQLAGTALLGSVLCWITTMCMFADPTLTQIAARLPETDTFEWYGAQYLWDDLQEALAVLLPPDVVPRQLLPDQYEDPFRASTWGLCNSSCQMLLGTLASAASAGVSRLLCGHLYAAAVRCCLHLEPSKSYPTMQLPSLISLLQKREV